MNRTPLRSHARLALALLLTLAAPLGCGLSTNDEPEPLQAEAPPELGGEAPPSTPVPVPGATGAETADVWFLRSEESGTRHLELLQRTVQSSTSYSEVVDALFSQPPTAPERSQGYATFVPEGARLVGRPRLTDGVLEVDLSEGFYALQGPSSRYAFAQVVYTVTEIDGVEEVQFMLNGTAFEAVDGDGQARDRPVERADYRNLESEE